MEPLLLERKSRIEWGEEITFIKNVVGILVRFTKGEHQIYIPRNLRDIVLLMIHFRKKEEHKGERRL